MKTKTCEADCLQCDRCGGLDLVGPDADIHRFAVVVWRAEDVQERAEEDFGIEITETKAEEFLAAYEREMQEAMTRAGWQIIDLFIPDFFEEEIEKRRAETDKRAGDDDEP